MNGFDQFPGSFLAFNLLPEEKPRLFELWLSGSIEPPTRGFTVRCEAIPEVLDIVVNIKFNGENAEFLSGLEWPKVVTSWTPVKPAFLALWLHTPGNLVSFHTGPFGEGPLQFLPGVRLSHTGLVCWLSFYRAIGLYAY